MIKQKNHYGGGHAEPRSAANSADQVISSAQIKNAVDEDLKRVEVQRMETSATPKGMRNAERRTLEAHAERRGRLAARIRAENPSCTEEEIEARLEQFGA